MNKIKDNRLTDRNIGLDICRIISMIGIILLHIVGQGGVLGSVEVEYSVSYWATEWVFICAICSVDIFAMMSGYFGIRKKKETVYRAVELMAIVLFWSGIITLGFLFIAPAKFTGIKDILKGFFQQFVSTYWYITCFVPVLVLQPFINKMLLSLTEQQHFKLIISEILLFSCVPSVIPIDFFRFNGGYSFVWLALLYSVGAYLNRAKDNIYFRYLKKYGIIVFLLLSFTLLLGNVFVYKIKDWNMRYMVSYISPVVLTMGLCVILPLSDIKLGRNGKRLESLSATAFDVYLIHGHALIYALVFAGAFAWIANMSWYYIPVLCVLCAVSVFLFCSFFGYIRIRLFDILKIKRLIVKISSKIDKLLYSDFTPSERGQ